MNTQTLHCPNCGAEVRTDAINSETFVPCRNCEVPVLVELFPAVFRDLEPGATAERIVVDDQASCFFHPQKKAVVSCDLCGRFLCALCDLELNQQHLCPTCLSQGQREAPIEKIQRHRVLYDSAALGLALLPILAWPLTCLTAPAAVFLAVYSWNKPSSIVRRTHFRAVLAILFGSLEIVAWVIGFIVIFSDR